MSASSREEVVALRLVRAGAFCRHSAPRDAAAPRRTPSRDERDGTDVPSPRSPNRHGDGTICCPSGIEAPATGMYGRAVVAPSTHHSSVHCSRADAAGHAPRSLRHRRRARHRQRPWPPSTRARPSPSAASPAASRSNTSTPTCCATRQFIQMFLDAGRLAAQIHHPNVVTRARPRERARPHVHGLGVRRGRPAPRARQSHCATPATTSPPVALRVMLDTLAGLHAAHELTGDDGTALPHRPPRRGLPAQHPRGLDGITRIVDFGIARPRGASPPRATGS